MDSKKQEKLQEARGYNLALKVTNLQQWCLNAFKHKNIMFIIVHGKQARNPWFECCEPYIFTVISLIKLHVLLL